MFAKLARIAVTVLALAGPTRAATIAYWEFDNGDITNAAVNGGSHNYTLTNTGGLTSDTTNLVNAIPNPDTTVGFSGDATANAGRANINTTGGPHYGRHSKRERREVDTVDRGKGAVRLGDSPHLLLFARK